MSGAASAPSPAGRAAFRPCPEIPHRSKSTHALAQHAKTDRDEAAVIARSASATSPRVRFCPDSGPIGLPDMLMRQRQSVDPAISDLQQACQDRSRKDWQQACCRSLEPEQHVVDHATGAAVALDLAAGPSDPRAQPEPQDTLFRGRVLKFRSAVVS